MKGTTMNQPHIVDNTPCPCILWSLSGRDPADYHNARKKIEADCPKHEYKDGECTNCHKHLSREKEQTNASN